MPPCTGCTGWTTADGALRAAPAITAERRPLAAGLWATVHGWPGWVTEGRRGITRSIDATGDRYGRATAAGRRTKASEWAGPGLTSLTGALAPGAACLVSLAHGASGAADAADAGGWRLRLGVHGCGRMASRSAASSQRATGATGSRPDARALATWRDMRDSPLPTGHWLGTAQHGVT